MQILLMLQDDWEIYGDGSGDPEKLMRPPLKKALEICDKYGAKYTIFAEVGQQLAMKDSTLKRHQQDAKLWEAALVDSLKRGHDVQLHFHPQWIGAEWKNNEWKLDYTRWAISHLAENEALHWLKMGKEYLEGLLQTVNPDYKVVAFRAGSWMMQPSETILNVLKSLGVIADVTVIKGMKLENEELGSIDFRDAYSSLIPWYADQNNLIKFSENLQDILCIPTYAEEIYLPPLAFEFLNNPFSIVYSIKRFLHRRRHSSYQPMYFKAKQGSSNQSFYIQHHQILRELFKRRTLVCDFGSTHYSTLIKMIERAARMAEKHSYFQIPFIMMTHSKNFYSFTNFESLLRELSKKAEIQFETTRAVVSSLKGKCVKDWLKGELS